MHVRQQTLFKSNKRALNQTLLQWLFVGFFFYLKILEKITANEQNFKSEECN